MSKFSANIFFIQTTSNYFWSSAVCKNQSFKVDNFVLPLILAPKLRSVEINEKIPKTLKMQAVVCIKKILVQNLLIYIYLHCVRRLS